MFCRSECNYCLWCDFGEYALIGSGAVIHRDVTPYALMVGVPAKQIGWVGISGNTLKFNNDNIAHDSDGKRYVIIDKKLKEI